MDGRPTKRSSKQEIDRMREEHFQKVKALELQLEEERRKREELENKWNKTQYDEVWDDQDGCSQWHEAEDVEDTKGYSSKGSSCVVVLSVKDTPQST